MGQSWIGIRVSATLAILGSLLTLLIAGVLVWIAFNGAPDQGAILKPALIALAVFFVCLTGWGVATGAAVFRHRAWARSSMIIFAVLLVGMGASALLGIAIVHMPTRPDVSEQALRNVRLIIAAFYAGLLMVGAWWLLLFNSARAKEYFSHVAVAPAATPAPLRPLSISIIGWYLLLLALCTGAAAATRLPMIFFSTLATGWVASAIYSAFTAIEIYLGTALLQLQEQARIGAIVFFVFSATNWLVSIGRPGFSVRMEAFLNAMPHAMRPEIMMLPESYLAYGVAGALVAWLPVWFLVRRRAAFGG